jgi:hypothetical protein
MWHGVQRIALPLRPFLRVQSNQCPPVHLSYWNNINPTGRIFVKFHMWKRRIISQAVSVRPLAVENSFRYQASPYAICAGISVSVTGCLRVLPNSHFSIIPLMIRTYSLISHRRNWQRCSIAPNTDAWDILYTRICWLILIFYKLTKNNTLFFMKTYVHLWDLPFILSEKFHYELRSGAKGNEDLNISTFTEQIQVTRYLIGWGDKYLKLGISPVTPSTRNAMSRLFTRETREMRHLALHERTRNAISRRLRDKTQRGWWKIPSHVKKERR